MVLQSEQTIRREVEPNDADSILQACILKTIQHRGRVLRHSGMTYEEALRKYVGFGDSLHDCLMFARVK